MIWRLEDTGPPLRRRPRRARRCSRRLRGLAQLAGDPTCGRACWSSSGSLQHGVCAPRPHAAAASARKAPAGQAFGVGWRWGRHGSPAGISRQEISREARLLQPLLRHPEWLQGYEEDFGRLQLADPRLELLRQEIVAWFVEAGNLDAEALQRHLLRYGFGPLLDQFAADLTQPTAPATEIDDAAHRQGWRDMLAATRHRAALHRERPTEDELRLGDGAEINRWFNRLDRLLNRDGADDAEADDGSTGAAELTGYPMRAGGGHCRRAVCRPSRRRA